MLEFFRRIMAISKLTVIDGIRRHALLGLILLALAAEAGGLFFFDFIPRDIGRASSDFLFSVGWLTGFLFLLFHAVHAIAWDEDRRTIHTILARPISRVQYVLGSFAGLAFLLLILNCILGALGYWLLSFIQTSVTSHYFQTINLSYYLISWAGLYGIELIVLSVIFLFSGLVRGGFPVLLLTISYYAICNGLPVVRESVSRATDNTTESLTSILQWLTFIFPDFSRFDFKNLVIDETAVLANYLLIDLAIVLGYVTVMLWLTCITYQRRDLQ